MNVTMKKGKPLHNTNKWCKFAAEIKNIDLYEQLGIPKDDFCKRNESWSSVSV